MGRLRALWSGELPLGEAFWGYAVLGGLAVNLVTTLAFWALLVANRPVAALLVGYPMPIAYNVVATVGVWRAAGRDPGDPRRAMLARIVTLAGMALLSLV